MSKEPSKKKMNKQTSTREKTGKNKINTSQMYEKKKVKKENILEDLLKKNTELNDQLTLNYSQIQKEKEETLESLKQINEEINIKNEELRKLKIKNKYLTNILRSIQNEVDKKIKKINFNNLKDSDFEDKEEKIKEEINVQKKEIENTINLIIPLQKEREKYEKILNDILEDNINNKYNTLNNEINELENNVNTMREETNNHKNCFIRMKNLKDQSNLLKNELDFEKKKLQLNESIEIKKQNYSYQEDESIDYSKISLFKNKSFNNRINNSYIYQKKKLKLSNEGKERREKEKIKNNLFPIWKQFNKKNNNYINYIKYIPKRNNYNNNFLFSNDEKKILFKIIPEEFIDNYEQKFETIENKKDEIIEEYKDSIEIKKQLKNNINLKINESEKKMDNLKKEEKVINNELLKQRNMINTFKLQIKEINKDIKNILGVEKFKNNENSKLKEFISNLQDKIDKGELILIKEKENEENEENEKLKSENKEKEEEEKEKEEEEEKEKNEDNESNV